MNALPRITRRLEDLMRKPETRATSLQGNAYILCAELQTSGLNGEFDEYVPEWNERAVWKWQLWETPKEKPMNGRRLEFASLDEVIAYLATGKEPPARDCDELDAARRAAQTITKKGKGTDNE